PSVRISAERGCHFGNRPGGGKRTQARSRPAKIVSLWATISYAQKSSSGSGGLAFGIYNEVAHKVIEIGGAERRTIIVRHQRLCLTIYTRNIRLVEKVKRPVHRLQLKREVVLVAHHALVLPAVASGHNHRIPAWLRVLSGIDDRISNLGSRVVGAITRQICPNKPAAAIHHMTIRALRAREKRAPAFRVAGHGVRSDFASESS